jgi:hypothetical protein
MNNRIRNCCGLIAIFNGMRCEAPDILENYNIKTIQDLMELLIYGKEKHLSIYNTFINNKEVCIIFNSLNNSLTNNKCSGDNILKIMLDHQQKKFIENDKVEYKSNRATFCYFYIWVSLYFKIKFKLIGEKNYINNIKYIKINDIIDKFNFKKIIKLTVIPDHISFEPNYKINTKKYNILKELNDNQMKKCYNEKMLMSANLFNEEIELDLQRYDSLTQEEKEKEDNEFNALLEDIVK